MNMNVSPLTGTTTEADTSGPLDLSVVVAVDGAPDLRATLEMYRPALDALQRPYEVICAIDGQQDEVLSDMLGLASTWPQLLVLGLRPWADEDAALQAIVKRARGAHLLTLAGWPEIAPAGISDLLKQLETVDMAVAVREGRQETGRERVLQGTLRTLFGRSWTDLFCRTRTAKRTAMEEASAFGVRQHFLPTISAELGRTVTEVPVTAAPADAEGKATFVFKPLGHIRALFDALMLYVVLKFLRRPLRFFGAVGLPILLLGAAITATYLGMRLFGGIALGDRPGLIFGVLMIVLGLQVIAMGLIGEIIIFANSRQMKQYTVKSVLRGPLTPQGGTPNVGDTARSDPEPNNGTPDAAP
ncbi:MAG: glycosyl transferase family 2 [Pseudomonadota bacterium]